MLLLLLLSLLLLSLLSLYFNLIMDLSFKVMLRSCYKKNVKKWRATTKCEHAHIAFVEVFKKDLGKQSFKAMDAHGLEDSEKYWQFGLRIWIAHSLPGDTCQRTCTRHTHGQINLPSRTKYLAKVEKSPVCYYDVKCGFHSIVQ